MPQDPQAARKSRSTGHTRQRLGCLTCRRRKKKCDRCYPVCGHCTRLNLICEHESPRSVQQVSRHRAEPTTASALSAPSSCIDATTPLTGLAFDGDLSRSDILSSRRAMLRYYTTSFATMLTTNHENNCFLSVLLPMAFESTTLMYTLTAWASIHLSQIDTRFQEIALQHRGAALRLLKTELEEKTISREMWLAVTMALCSMEIISDGVQNWYEHLVGGATALSLSHDSGALYSIDVAELATTEGKWLMRNFAYHDILASVTMDRPPILAGDDWVHQDDQQADPYFGLAAQIVFLVGKISQLNADLAAADEDTSFSDQLPNHAVGAELSDRARTIENELLDWKCPSQHCGSSLAQLAETYRDAALLHLYRTLRRHLAAYATVLSGKIRRHVEAICVKVRDMPIGCLPECTLLFPLFMAGGEAEELAHIAIIREKMRLIHEHRRFRNIEVCLQILDELWRLRIAGAGNERGNRVDWLDIIQSKGYKLAIT